MRIWKKLIARIKSFFVYSNCDKQKKEGKDLLHNGNSWYNMGVKSNIEEGVNDMYTVFDIANWFLSKQPMSHKKLQKMCYYAQAWSYALHNRPIMNTEFQAWVHGPVSPELYQKYKGNGFQDLTCDTELEFTLSEEDSELLESVMLTYGDHTGNALEALTHTELPWIEARHGLDPAQNCENKINPDTMRKYYQSIYAGGDA